MRHILSVLLLLVALTTQGQRAYHIKHFGETDELRVRGEVSIAQVNGFIFVGTSEGLRAFDGKHASLYRVPDNDRAGGFYGMITGVVQSADGVIWAGTHRGFYTFDIEHERLVPYRVDENLSRVRYLMLSREGTVWMGDVEGLLYRYDEPNNRVRAYTVKPEGAKEFRKIAAITEMQDGSLAVTSETDGVCLFSVKDFSSRLLFDKDEGKPLLAHTAITPDGTNLWVGTERGIVICNVKTGALSALRQSDTAFHTLTDNAVYTLFLDQEMGVSVVGWTRETDFSHDGVYYNRTGLTVLPAYIHKCQERNLPALWLPPIPDVDTMQDFFHNVTLVHALCYCSEYDDICPPHRTADKFIDLGFREIIVAPNNLFDPRGHIDQ